MEAPLTSARCIEVADTGPAIHPDLLPRIFDMFVATKAPGKASGLGFATCHQIIKAHGGEIQVSSRIGKRTCFCVFLPLEASVGRSPRPVPR